MNKDQARSEALLLIRKLRQLGFDFTLCHDPERKVYYLKFHQIMGVTPSFHYTKDEEK
jgi:hypothetical protein